jgi:nucleotide-binding universal stress UspA family protein
MSSLSPAAANEFYADLRDSLPPPVNPTPELRERRLTTAIETFNALRPANAYEARLAVKVVVCGAHGIDALRLASVFHDDFVKMSRCRAQAARMMRDEQAAKRTLDQEQKARRAVEAVAGSAPVRPAIASALPHAEPQAGSLPLHAAVLTPQAPAAAPTAASVAGAPRHPGAANPASQTAAAESVPPPSPEAIAKAEAFIEENIAAAAQIRRDRGVTPQNKAHFPDLTLPMDPETIDALVRGTSDLLTLLDEVGGEDLDNAA